jgi:hypothetical protein
LEDSQGHQVAIPHHPQSLKWRLQPGFGPVQS